MSLYTWLSDHSMQYYNPPYDKDKYLRYPHELDLSNPQCGVGWKRSYEGATFVNVSTDVTSIKHYITQTFNDKAGELVPQIVDLAVEKLREDINLSVKDAVDLAIAEITHIYGGSAADLINEESDADG